MAKSPYELANEILKPEQTAKNAESFARREIEKYIDQPGTYGGISGLVDVAGDQYYLRDDEKEWLKNQIRNFINKKYSPFLKGWDK